MDGHLTAVPSLVRQGTPTTLYWNVSNADCTVTGNGQTWTEEASGAIGKQTTIINQQRTFTLSCEGHDNSDIVETEVVNVIPVFKEI